MSEIVRWIDDIYATDLAEVGGKNASPEELTRSLADQGIHVPPGFVTTASASRRGTAAASGVSVIPSIQGELP